MINSTEQSPWETSSPSASQEAIHILWNSEVRYHIHKSPPPIRIMCQINPVLAPHPTSIRYILILPSYICLGLPSHLFDSNFPQKSNSAFLIPPHFIHALYVLSSYLINGENYKVCSSLSCSIVQHPIISHTIIMHNSSATLQINHSITGSMEQMIHLLM